jgi:hypothetical protein
MTIATVSVNGGPEVPFGAFEKRLQKARPETRDPFEALRLASQESEGPVPDVLRYVTKIRHNPTKKDKPDVVMQLVEPIAPGQGRRDERIVRFRSEDAPRPQFREAQEELGKAAAEALLEVTEEWAGGWPVCIAASLKRDEKNAYALKGACLTLLCRKAAFNSPLVLNTPYLPPDEGENGGKGLPWEVADPLREWEKEAEAFLQGLRAQGELFGG